MVLFVVMAVGNAYGADATARFVPQPSGAVLDNSTGRYWAADASTPMFDSCTGGKKTWVAAFDYISCLNSNNYLGYNNWRLPSMRELASQNIPITEKEGSLAAWLNGNGFQKVRSSYYWSADGVTEDLAVAVDKLWSGYSHTMSKASLNYVWPVRTGP